MGSREILHDRCIRYVGLDEIGCEKRKLDCYKRIHIYISLSAWMIRYADLFSRLCLYVASP